MYFIKAEGGVKRYIKYETPPALTGITALLYTCFLAYQNEGNHLQPVVL
jgi:hypothetical protein